MLPDDYPLQESLLPQPVPRDFVDYTFPAGDGFSLDLRVWPYKSAGQSSTSTPWVFWVHGGAFCSGSHYAPPSWVIPAFREKGYHVVSTSYRLAPYADLQMILSDCQAGLEWCRRKLPVLLDDIDPNAFVIGGDSAGGTLALLLAQVSLTVPRAVIDVYGITDFTAYDVEPRSPFPPDFVGEPIPMIMAPFPWELENVSIDTTRQRWAAPDFEYSPKIIAQTAITAEICNHRQYLTTLLRLRASDDRARRRQILNSVSPHQLIVARQAFPPTAFLHGGGDETVPLSHSTRLATSLEKMGVPVHEAYEPWVPHAFDQLYVGPEVPEWDRVIRPLVDFVDRKTRSLYDYQHM